MQDSHSFSFCSWLALFYVAVEFLELKHLDEGSKFWKCRILNFMAISCKLLFYALGLYKLENFEIGEVCADLHHLYDWPVLCKQVM